MATTQEKAEFIKHLLRNHTPKRNELKWLLSYLTTNPQILEKLHFVEDASSFPLGMRVGFEKTPSIPFRFYIGGVMTSDAERCFNKLRTMREEEIFIEVNYPDKYQDVHYIEIVEGELPSEVSNPELDNLMESIIFMNKEYYINQALDSNNKELFIQLTGGN